MTSADSADSISLALASAQRAMQEGRAADAMRILGPLAQGSTRSAAILGALGDAYLQAGALDEAVRALANAVALEPTNAALRMRLACALERAGRAKAAGVQRQEASRLAALRPAAPAASSHAVVGAGAPPVQAGPPAAAMPPFVLPTSTPQSFPPPHTVSRPQGAHDSIPPWSPLKLGPLFTRPQQLFEEQSQRAAIGPVVGFLAVLLLCGALAAALVRENRVAGAAPDVVTLIGRMLLGFGVAAALALVAGLAIAFALAAIHHAVARAFGAAAPFAVTFAVVGYSLAPAIVAAHVASTLRFGISPVRDPAVLSAYVLMGGAAVWSWVLMFTGFRAAHRMRVAGALAAVLVPALLVIGAAIVVALLQTARLAALAP